MLSVSPRAIRDTSGKLKQSNIARSQYATQLIVYACVYAKKGVEARIERRHIFIAFPREYWLKLFLQQTRE